jgi:hypothetical protein
LRSEERKDIAFKSLYFLQCNRTEPAGKLDWQHYYPQEPGPAQGSDDVSFPSQSGECYLSVALYTGNNSEDIVIRNNAIRNAPVVSPDKQTGFFGHYNAVNYQLSGIRQDKRYNIPYTRVIRLQRSKGNNILIPDKGRHAETAGSKAKRFSLLCHSPQQFESYCPSNRIIVFYPDV